MPEPYRPEEFPDWALDLRRAEIVFFGSLPFSLFFTFEAYDLGRFVASGFDPLLAPWPMRAGSEIGGGLHPGGKGVADRGGAHRVARGVGGRFPARPTAARRVKTAEAVVDDPGLAGTRLDRFVADRMGLFTRSQARSRISALWVNGEPARPARRLKPGDRVTVAYDDPPPEVLAPEAIPLSILFENDDVVVVDKPQGMVVHPGSGNRSGTLVNALLAHWPASATAYGAAEARPGIVHRLDKDTSGVIVTAKNPVAHESLARQFHDRRVRKLYLAIVRGGPPRETGRVDDQLARSRADRQRFVPVAAGAGGPSPTGGCCGVGTRAAWSCSRRGPDALTSCGFTCVTCAARCSAIPSTGARTPGFPAPR